MEFDPVNRDVPAPRYELESGSEDEFEAARDTRETQEPVRIVPADGSGSSSALESNTQLVVLIGNAGVALLSSLQGSAPAEQYSLRTESDQHAAIAVVDRASGGKVTAALVAPPPQLGSWRFHDIAQTLIEAAQPSSIVIVDSYSPQEQLYRDPYSDDDEEHDRVDNPMRYLATPSYLTKNKVDARGLTPLRSPEAASGLGAAFLSKAVVSSIPAILTLLEDVSFQSHVQLYGSLGAARLSRAASEVLSSLTGLDGKQGAVAASEKTILDFATSRRVKPAANLGVLGDGNMYI
ncbi:hypothetical protein NDA16_003119 [Ustilago loliicola]|nr:hypothetical protein NDA16_003119 [Ustilago loliicola]